MAEDLTAGSVAEEGVSTTAQNAPANDAFKADPNQFVFDKEHAVDFQVDVVDVYFAEKKEVWEAKQDQYQVNSGGTGADVVEKYKKDGRRNITTDVGTNDRLRAHQLVSVKWEEKKVGEYKYEKISKTIIGKKVFVVAKCSGDSGTLKLTILENKLDNKADVYNGPVKFLDGETEKTVIEFQLDGSGTYQKEIVLRPKSDEDFKTLVQKFIERPKKNAFIYFKAEVTGTRDEVKYPGNKPEFLNVESIRFEVIGTPCYCNRDLTVDEMLELIYFLRKKQSLVTYKERFFDRGAEFISVIRNGETDGALTDNKAKVELFVNAMNSMFTKFDVQSCKRKIHFIAQMYLETASFRATYEGRTASNVPANYFGGADFQGRGMKQITHDYNYLAYNDYIEGTNHSANYGTGVNRNERGGATESVGAYIARVGDSKLPAGFNAAFYEHLKNFAKRIAEDIFHAFNSAGWFTTVYRRDTLVAMDAGLGNENVRLVTRAINGGETNLTERQDYTSWVKEFFKYDTDCVNK